MGEDEVDEADSLEAQASWFRGALQNKMKTGARICKTGKRHLCYVKRLAEIGDVICIVDGSSMPMVLRRAGRYDKISAEMRRDLEFWIFHLMPSFFMLVGDAYVHGNHE